MNGGLWPLFHAFGVGIPSAVSRARRFGLIRIPHGFISRLFGIGAGGWGDWLLYQGTLVAVIAAALTIMLVSSPVNRRVLSLLAVPFALGAVIYLCSLISPPPPASVGNTLVAVPLLLMLLVAMAFSLGYGRRPGPDVPGRPPAPGGA
jgi:hypothetical protein